MTTQPPKNSISPEYLQLLMKFAERNIHRERLNGIYWQMLRRYVPLESIAKVDNAVIVSLACGKADDAEVQAQYVLENLLSTEDGKARFIGVDLPDSELPLANRANRNDYNGRVAYEFMPGDARDLGTIIREDADVFFISHSEPVSLKEVWKGIIAAMKPKHTKGGLLVATFHNEDEMEALRSMIGKDYAILAATINEYAIPDPHLDNIYSHKVLLAARRL